MSATRSEIRDGMQIDWDVPITVDDGLVLRADVFRPTKEGKYPVILSYGPYAKNLSFQQGYSGSWDIMVAQHPDVPYGSTNKYQNWEVVDPEKWVPDGYAIVRVDSRGCGCSPGVIDHWSPRETTDLYRMGRRPAVVYRQNRLEWNLLLRHEPVAGRRETASPSGGDVLVGRG